MSLQQTAFLERKSVPDRQALQAAVKALGFDCEVDSSYAPFQSEGFLPCILNGKQSGFEIYFESAAEPLKSFPHRAELVGSRGVAVTFRWGGDMAECACVLIVSAALAKEFDAVVHYRNDDLVYSLEQLVKEAGVALKHARKARR